MILGAAVGLALFFPDAVGGQSDALLHLFLVDVADALFDLLREVLVCHDIPPSERVQRRR
jgi:hypothetical protein